MFDVARIEQLRDEYPINLLKTIAAEQTRFEFNADEITEDKLDGLAHIIASLPEREQQILQLRYQERKTLREIGEIIGVTLERIRSQEHRAIYKLATPPRLGYIKYGKVAYEKLIAERKAEKEYNERGFNIPLEELDLSVRAFNNLKKIGCDTVADVVDLTEEKILSVNSLGVKTRTEIAVKLVSLGAFNTAWSHYLPKEKK